MPHSDKPVPSLTPQITSPDQRQLTKLQQEFNQKVEQIEQLKQNIAARREGLNKAQERLEKELRPILDKVVQKRVELVMLLDEAFAMSFFKRPEKEKLAFLIIDMTQELIAMHGRQDMLEIHDKYAEQPYHEGTSQTDGSDFHFAEEVFKVAFGTADDMDNLDAFDYLQAQLDRETEQREQQKQNRQKNRKTKAQLEKETKAKAEITNISKASRKIYTELAKLLHPDKEQDETLHASKEEAMKKVILAYHNDDFFELLRLQMEFLQEHTLNKLPDDQLKYYVKLLEDQVEELQHELSEFSHGPDADFFQRFGGTQKQMDQKFKQAKLDLKQELENLKQNLRFLQDPQQIRLLLKEAN